MAWHRFKGKDFLSRSLCDIFLFHWRLWVRTILESQICHMLSDVQSRSECSMLPKRPPLQKGLIKVLIPWSARSVQAAHFITFCDAFHLPLVTFLLPEASGSQRIHQDRPVPIRHQGEEGSARAGLLFAHAQATVPKLLVGLHSSGCAAMLKVGRPLCASELWQNTRQLSRAPFGNLM